MHRLNYRFFLLLLSGLLLGCNATTPARPGGAPSPEQGNNAVQGAAAGASAAASGGQEETAPLQSGASAAISSRLDQLAGWLTLMQEQLLQLRADSQRLQEQNQMLLNRLQLIGGNVQPAGEGDTDDSGAAADAAGTEQLDAVIGQLMQLINSLDNAGSGGGEYAITTTYTRSGDWVLLRYHRLNGSTWLADGDGWRPLQERQTPPPGDYQVLVHRADQDSKGYVAVRIDRSTGYSWWLKDTYWQEYMRD